MAKAANCGRAILPRHANGVAARGRSGAAPPSKRFSAASIAASRRAGRGGGGSGRAAAISPSLLIAVPYQPCAPHDPYRRGKGGKAGEARRGRKNGKPSASLIARIAGWSNVRSRPGVRRRQGHRRTRWPLGCRPTTDEDRDRLIRDAVGGGARKTGLVPRLSASTLHSARISLPRSGGTKRAAGAVGRLPDSTTIWLRALSPRNPFRLHLDLISSGSAP